MNERETRLAIEYITLALDEIRDVLKIYAKPKGSKGMKDIMVNSFMIDDLEATVDRLKEFMASIDEEDCVI